MCNYKLSLTNFHGLLFLTISVIIFSQLSFFFERFFIIFSHSSKLVIVTINYFVEHLGVWLSIHRKFSKNVCTIKVEYCFVNIFNNWLTVTSNFINIYWWKSYVNINVTIYHIVVSFVINGNISFIFCQDILVITKNKSKACRGVINDMSEFFNDLLTSCSCCEGVSFLSCWISDIIFPIF